MNPIQTDPRTGRRYQVGPDGVSRWVDEQPSAPSPAPAPAPVPASAPTAAYPAAHQYPAGHPANPAGPPNPTGQPNPGERPGGTPPAAPARSGRRLSGRWIVALVLAAVLGISVIGVAVWAWPTTAGCEAQVDAEVVKALQSKDITNFQPNTDQSHYWRCFGQSDQAMDEITQRVLARHTGELVQKGIEDLLG